MTHELKHIFNAYLNARAKGVKAVISTVVGLDGSSYRKPGVRMLVLEDGQMVGAVSGGCVEKEILRAAIRVFRTGKSRMLQYDGRYRLGCEGTLHILTEPFALTDEAEKLLKTLFDRRRSFTLESFFRKEEGEFGDIGTRIVAQGAVHQFNSFLLNDENLIYKQTLPPEQRLLIIGAEHDASALSSMASNLGWDIVAVVPADSQKMIGDFPGASRIIHSTLSSGEEMPVDAHTAVVVMNHNYARDLLCLMTLHGIDAPYVGLLGAVRRREQLIVELMNSVEELDLDFLDRIHGPAGLDIGSVTPQEIALSILAEIVAFLNDRQTISLRDKTAAVHQ